MFTTVGLVTRLMKTRRFADRPRSGRPRVTSWSQSRSVCFSHLRMGREHHVQSNILSGYPASNIIL